MTGAAQISGPLPAGLARLRDLGQALARVRTAPDSPSLRVMVTVPTIRLATLAAALGARLAGGGCRSCGHVQLAEGIAVARYADKQFVDQQMGPMGNGFMWVGGVQLTRHHDSVHRLPDGFPQRSGERMGDCLQREAARLYDCDRQAAGFHHSAASAHPVVVAGEPAAFRADVAALDAAAPALTLLARLDCGDGLSGWFRHPVLAAGSLPGPDAVPWSGEVEPRLVILAGTVGWSASWRGHWPTVPILVLLPRRSPSAADVAETVSIAGWAKPPAADVGLSEDLVRPGAGLEIALRLEPVAAPGDDEDEEAW